MIKTVISLICTALLISSCASTTDPTPQEPTFALSTFDLKAGDKLEFESTTSTQPDSTTLTTVLVIGVSGAPGAQVLLREDFTYRMRGGYLETYRGTETPVKIAQFPTTVGDTVIHVLDTLKNPSGSTLQIYDKVVTTVHADTTITTPAGSIRCAVFQALSVPTLTDGVGVVVTKSLSFVSPSLGIITDESQLWAGTTTDGPPFGSTTSKLVKITRK